jgi:hypothetical protein
MPKIFDAIPRQHRVLSFAWQDGNERRFAFKLPQRVDEVTVNFGTLAPGAGAWQGLRDKTNGNRKASD